MKLKGDKKICTFTFRNATVIRVAVPWFDNSGNNYDFETMLRMGKDLSWTGDENHGRGGLMSFEVGDIIHA